MAQQNLIRLTEVLDLVAAVIWSGRVADSTPVSAILVATPESAKTQVLMHYYGTKTLQYFSSVTAKPLLDLKPQIEAGRIRHIVLPELVSTSAHARDTTARLLITLSMLMEDGATTYADAGRTVEFQGLPRIGLIGAMTPTFYSDNRLRWVRYGFLTRVLGIHFDYSEPTIQNIHELIRTGAPIPPPAPLELPDKSIPVSLPDRLATRISELALDLAKKYESKGFRFHRALRTLAKARALSQGRYVVENDDLVTLMGWIKYFDDLNPVRL